MPTESDRESKDKSSMDSPTSPIDASMITNTDASLYLIKDLKQLQSTSAFDKFDFSRCPVAYFEKLFVAAPDSYMPPHSYRVSASKINEWINMTLQTQEQMFAELGLEPTARFKRAPRRMSASKKFADAEGGDDAAASPANGNEKGKRKITKKKDKNDKAVDTEQPPLKKARKTKKLLSTSNADFDPLMNALTGTELAHQEKANDLLRSEQYSANGSILFSDDEADEDANDDDIPRYKGRPIALDTKSLQQFARQRASAAKQTPPTSAEADSDEETSIAKKAGAAATEPKASIATIRANTPRGHGSNNNRLSLDSCNDEDELYNGASIFGQTQGQNATWVECNRCSKWRRLRGKVDVSKLPAKWFCSMNKSDPARAKCSAPEESYDENHAVTPESAADARARKHTRVWSRRIKTQESYEARQPPMTRGKKRQVAGCKDPYEWIRCCNPSCGKWRALLRVMGAKSHVIDHTANGEWYCIMNTWDEKMASCAAPQENLPTAGCPSWVQQDP